MNLYEDMNKYLEKTLGANKDTSRNLKEDFKRIKKGDAAYKEILELVHGNTRAADILKDWLYIADWQSTQELKDMIEVCIRDAAMDDRDRRDAKRELKKAEIVANAYGIDLEDLFESKEGLEGKKLAEEIEDGISDEYPDDLKADLIAFRLKQRCKELRNDIADTFDIEFDRAVNFVNYGSTGVSFKLSGNFAEDGQTVMIWQGFPGYPTSSKIADTELVAWIEKNYPDFKVHLSRGEWIGAHKIPHAIIRCTYKRQK